MIRQPSTTIALFVWTIFFFALVAPSADAWSSQQQQTVVHRHQLRNSEVRRFSSCGSDVVTASRASADDDDDDDDDYDDITDGFSGAGPRGDDSVRRLSLSSRRHVLLRSAAALSASGILWGAGGGNPAAAAEPAASAAAGLGYRIRKVEPDEKDIYRTAQAQRTTGDRPLRVLWVGSGAFALKTSDARSGVYKDLFRAGTEVTALDLLQPVEDDLRDAQAYAADNGYTLRFRRGDATELGAYFEAESFDAVVSSLFLCQDFDPAQVCREIRNVLKPNGRYGFYEHVDGIDKVVIGQVFGDRSVIKVEYDPDMFNVLAGVVEKV